MKKIMIAAMIAALSATGAVAQVAGAAAGAGGGGVGAGVGVGVGGAGAGAGLGLGLGAGLGTVGIVGGVLTSLIIVGVIADAGSGSTTE